MYFLSFAASKYMMSFFYIHIDNTHSKTLKSYNSIQDQKAKEKVITSYKVTLKTEARSKRKLLNKTGLI